MTGPPDSLCVDRCRMVDGLCEGCGRTAWEIADWHRYSPYRRAIVARDAKARLAERKPAD